MIPMYRLTVIRENGQRKIVEVERADQNHRLIVRWPNAGGLYEFDVVRNRMVRGVGWTFLEPHTARLVWQRMREEVRKKYGIGNSRIRGT